MSVVRFHLLPPFMKARWIIENFTDSEDYRNLISAVQGLGRDCFVIDKRNHFDFDSSGYKENECVIFQGSINMTHNIRQRLPKGCFPIAYNTSSNYLCSAYYPVFKDSLFNDRYEFTTALDLTENKFKYYEKFGKDAMIFIRPDSGEKTFSGQLLDLQYFDRFWNNHIVCNAKDEDVIIVSTPKQINGEWRFVCSKYNGGEIIAVSTYMYQGKRTFIPSAPAKATELCQSLLKKGYYPDSVFCIDICQDADGNFWLLELTSFSSAGLYATDKVKVAEKVTAIVEEEYKAILDR